MSDGSCRRRCCAYLSYVFFPYTCLFAPGNEVFPSQHLKTAPELQEHPVRDAPHLPLHFRWSHLNPQYLFLGSGHPVGDVCLSLCILPLFFPIDCIPPYSVIFLQHKAITLSEKPSKGLSLTNKETLSS